MQWSRFSCCNMNFSILLSCALVFVSSSLLCMLPWPVACIVGGVDLLTGGSETLQLEWPRLAVVGWARSSRWTDAVRISLENTVEFKYLQAVYEIAGPSGRAV